MGKFANYFNMPPTLLGGLFQWPRHGQGEGPVGYKFPPSGGDAGDNGRGRSEAESSGRVSPFLPQVSNTSTTKKGDLKSS